MIGNLAGWRTEYGQKLIGGAHPLSRAETPEESRVGQQDR